MEYTSHVAETVEKISEEELREKLKTALSGFGDDCTISKDGYVYTVNVWQRAWHRRLCSRRPATRRERGMG